MYDVELVNAIGNQTYTITDRVTAFNITKSLNQASSFSVNAIGINEDHLYDYINVYKHGQLYANGLVVKQQNQYKNAKGIFGNNHTANGLLNFTTFDCTDWSHLLTRRTVAEIFLNKTASYIINTVIQTYLPEITIHPTQFYETGIVLPEIICAYTTTMDVINKVLDNLYGWYWYIDQYRRFHLFYKNEDTINITCKDVLVDSLRLDKSGEDISNRIYVIGSAYAAKDYMTQTFTGDGQQRYFNLAYEPNYLEVKLNGVTKTVMEESADTEKTADFYVDRKAHLLYIPQRIATPYTGTIEIRYRPTQLIIDLQENKASIAKYGTMDRVIKDAALKTIEDVRKYARAELKRSSELTEARKISFSTGTNVKIGQKVLLDITIGNVSIKGTFRVNEVKITAIPDDVTNWETLLDVSLEEII